MARGVTGIPRSIILSAMDGDKNALTCVADHFQKYIQSFATLILYNALG